VIQEFVVPGQPVNVNPLSFTGSCMERDIIAGDEESAKAMADMFGPGQIDQTIRQALQYCWLSLPKDRKNLGEWEKQVRRIFERAVRDYREDSAQLGRWSEG